MFNNYGKAINTEAKINYGPPSSSKIEDSAKIDKELSDCFSNFHISPNQNSSVSFANTSSDNNNNTSSFNNINYCNSNAHLPFKSIADYAPVNLADSYANSNTSSNLPSFSGDASKNCFHMQFPLYIVPPPLGMPTMVTYSNVEDAWKKRNIDSHLIKTPLDVSRQFKGSYTFEDQKRIENTVTEFKRRKNMDLAVNGSSMAIEIAKKFGVVVVFAKYYFGVPANTNNVGQVQNSSFDRIQYEIGLPGMNSVMYINSKSQNDLEQNFLLLLEDRIGTTMYPIGCPAFIDKLNECTEGLPYGIGKMTAGQFIDSVKKSATEPVSAYPVSSMVGIEKEYDDSRSSSNRSVNTPNLKEVVYVEIGISAPTEK
ncbi:MAG: hypothetical protein LBI81_01675 [Puniceicoccales bacterium]|jgi:hypothetical protein|nr:hypothetical protein [Puniceicoccales bacterium]